MASTIKLKTGTGSAVPSALAQGEVGINIDNGLIYYGSGSGNAVKQLESFTHITASGNITASTIDLSGNASIGNFTNGNHTIKGLTFIGNTSTTEPDAFGQVLAVGGSSETTVKIYSTHTGANRDVGIHMSASANGQEFSIGLRRGNNSFYIAPSPVSLGPENTVFEIDASGNITASGDISSSGTITGNSIVGTLGTAAQTNITSVGTLSSLTVSGDITANGNIVGDDATDITNIESIFADNLVHDGDTDTKIAFGTNTVQVDAGGTTVFESSVTGSVLSKVHQNIYDTGSLAISTANGAMGDIVKFGGTATNAGGLYYLKPDGTWAYADADSTTTATGSLAVAVGTNSTTDGMCIRGFVNPFTDPGAGIGSPVYLSTTVGRIQAAAPSGTGDVVRIVGYQYGTDLVYFNPSNDYIVHA